jgi:opacity protein-like surface antigen
MKTRSKLLIISLAALFSLSAVAEEERPYYFEFGFGRSNGYVPYTGELPSGRYSGASVASVALGKQFNDRIAFDVELSYRGEYTNNDDSLNTTDGIQKATTSINSISTMLNGYFVYYNKHPDFKPYITAGAGISRNKTGKTTVSGTDANNDQLTISQDGNTNTSFSWKLGSGIRYKLDSSFDVDLRYQYVDLGNVSINNTTTAYSDGSYQGTSTEAIKTSRLSSHEILVGIIYKF